MSIPTLDSLAGDSLEQRQAETVMVKLLGEKLGGIALSKRPFDFPSGAWLEIDGWINEPLLLVEAWAHQGAPKPAQKHKVIADAFKLLTVEKLIKRKARKILLLSDRTSAHFFQGESWIAQGLIVDEIAVEVVDLPAELRVAVAAAQRRQYR